MQDGCKGAPAWVLGILGKCQIRLEMASSCEYNRKGQNQDLASFVEAGDPLLK